MRNTLKTIEFIRNNSNWEELFSQKPYCITVSRDAMFGRNLVLLKYNQMDSDFHNEIVRECRGLILDEDTFEPVCVPFFKFGNYGESYCPEIDWKNCWVGQKLDGSLIKIVRLGEDLLISTNGTIDAFKANLQEQIGCDSKNFGELVVEAIVDAFYDRIDWDGFGLPLCQETVEKECIEFFKSNLEDNKTYMFELTSPFNKVVVQWHETRLNFLGVRDNTTLQETYFNDHFLKDFFNTPKVFPLRTIDECVKAAQELGVDEEGFVVCDRDFNRVKVKSPTYVSLHHIKNNNILSYERGIEIVRGNELDEVLTYFPEFKPHLEKIRDDCEELKKKLNVANESMNEIRKMETRKEQALTIQRIFGRHSGVGFALLDGKIKDVDKWFMNCPSANLVKILGYKD